MFETSSKAMTEKEEVQFDYSFDYNYTDWLNITGPGMEAYDPKLYQEWNFAVIIGRYVPPVMLIFGTILNALTMAVLSHKRMRSAVPTIYMQFLLLTCTLALHVAVLPGWLRNLNVGEFTTLNVFSCKFYVYMSYFSTDIPAWVLVSCALHQVCGIILPEWTTKSVSRCRATMGVILVGVVLFLINMPMAIISKLFTWKSVDGTIKLCASEVHGTMKVFIKNFWPWVDFAMFAAVPALILMFTTTIFIIHLISIKRQQATVGFIPCYNATRMLPTLICLSMSFILMTSPICVNILFVRFGPKFNSTYQLAQNYLWYILGTISQYLFYASCFFSFLASPNFRYELRRILCPCLPNVLKEVKIFPVMEVDSSAEKINQVFIDDGDEGAEGTEV